MVTVKILCELSIASDGGVNLRHIPDIVNPRPQRNSADELFGFPARPSGPNAIAVLQQLPGWVVERYREEVNAAFARLTEARVDQPAKKG